MPNRKMVLTLTGLVFAAVLLGAAVPPAFCQQADDPLGLLGVTLDMIGRQPTTDANGNPAVQIKLYGKFGDVTLVVSEKQALKIMGDPNDGMAMRMDTALIASYYSKQIQQTFGATDEEWKVLAPKLRKVQSLTLQLVSRGRTARGKKGELTNFEKAWGALYAALKNKETKLDDLKKLLQVLSAEESNLKGELEQGRKELKELLTVRQEALLVQLGYLE